MSVSSRRLSRYLKIRTSLRVRVRYRRIISKVRLIRLYLLLMALRERAVGSSPRNDDLNAFIFMVIFNIDNKDVLQSIHQLLKKKP